MYDMDIRPALAFFAVVGVVGGIVAWELAQYLWTHISIGWVP